MSKMNPFRDVECIERAFFEYNWGQSHINLCSEPFITNGSSFIDNLFSDFYQLLISL
jgi:hypothetical protein